MKKNTLFFTGLSGFIGRNILDKVDFRLYQHVYAIGRNKTCEIERYTSSIPNFTFIKADIFDVGAYRQCLASANVIIHLAAVTGKVPREEYVKANRDATRVLLEHCRKDKVERFVFVSSIATKFKNIEHYYYAQSKLEAEADVQAAMVPYTILRPTIVLGKDSPILDSFIRMIKLPMVPIFGDGSNNIQPIFVKDLADYILHLIGSKKFIGETIEIGGPEIITIESFIKSLHRLVKGGIFRTFHLPVTPLAAFLTILEKHMLSILPFTAGQLSSFTNDGTSEKNPFVGREQITLLGIEEMLVRSLMMKETEVLDFEALKAECRIFGHYLIDGTLNAYTEKKYIQGHQKLEIEISEKPIDQLLLKKAVKSPFWVRLTDIYSSIFFRQAIVRKKLLLLIAILECQQDGYAHLDAVDEKTAFRLFLELGQKGIVSIIMLIISIILIGPFHATSKLSEKTLMRKQVS